MPTMPASALRATTTTSAWRRRTGVALTPMMTAVDGGKLKVGIVGATGAVGEEIVKVLGNRQFPVSELHLYASARSAGKSVPTPFGSVTIEEFELGNARGLDVIFLAVGGDFSLKYAHKLSEGDGPVVIDNSSAFRMDPDVPLVVPEINHKTAKGKKLIANPNCTTAIGLMALFPLHVAYGIKKVIMSTYQAASGAGAEGMDELKTGIASFVKGQPIKNEFFAYPLPFNVIPHIDVFQENGYTKEEMKVTWEARKILGVPDLAVSCTAVRIPTLRAHSEAIVIETEKPVTPEGAREVLGNFPGLKVVDDTSTKQYPMPLTATNHYDVEVGRIRQNIVFGDHGLELFVCGDQLLRGAALNAVIIAEML